MPYTKHDLSTRYEHLSDQDLAQLITAANADPNKNEFSDEEAAVFDVICGFFQDGRVGEGDWESAKKMYEEYIKEQQSKKRTAKGKKSTPKSETPTPALAEEESLESEAAEQAKVVVTAIQDNVKTWVEGTEEISDIAVEQGVNYIAQKIEEDFPVKLNKALKKNQEGVKVFLSEVKHILIAGSEGKKLNSLQSHSPPISRSRQLPESMDSSGKQVKTSDNTLKTDSSRKKNSSS